MASSYPLGVARELYSRKPEWWARWTWPMVAGIAVWTSSSAVSAETTFNHWTRKVQSDNVGATKKPGSDSASSPTIQWELRPFDQRALMSVIFLGFGTGLGIIFLSGRSRIVRRLHGVFSPASVASKTNTPEELRYLVVETLGNFSSGKGKVFPREQCELTSSRNDSGMYLKIQGAVPHRSSKFWLGLEDAEIQGRPVPGGTLAVREALLKSLGQTNKTGIWRTGPIVEGR
ncbi:hypothetical protein K439DRAFT_1657911 [Ramaria rubella]|nr:hypothetical protein K439DRAFT_1657911 [Ramaria rubella]